MQWHALSLASWSLATCLTKAAKHAFISGSFH
jgi:hypothetical protein